MITVALSQSVWKQFAKSNKKLINGKKERIERFYSVLFPAYDVTMKELGLMLGPQATKKIRLSP